MRFKPKQRDVPMTWRVIEGKEYPAREIVIEGSMVAWRVPSGDWLFKDVGEENSEFIIVEWGEPVDRVTP